MTKKAQVFDLLAKGYTGREIAQIVGCHESYVRTVKRRERLPASNAAWLRNYRRQQPERVRERDVRYYRARKASQEART